MNAHMRKRHSTYNKENLLERFKKIDEGTIINKTKQVYAERNIRQEAVENHDYPFSLKLRCTKK